MKRLATFLFLFSALSYIRTVSAWSFTWRNGSDYPATKHGTTPQACTQIDHAKGKQFDWNPEDDGLWIFLWGNDNCTGDSAGRSEPVIWRKNASIDLHSYLVGNGDGVAVITSSSVILSATPTASATSSNIPSSVSTGSSSSTPSGVSSSGTTLSGGTIAGIVIGAVAGLAILGAAFFFLGRRRHRKSPEANSQQGGLPATPSVPPDSDPGVVATPKSPHTELDTNPPPMSTAPTSDSPAYRHVAEGRVAELVGDNGMAEMGGTHRVNELEGYSKSPYG